MKREKRPARSESGRSFCLFRWTVSGEPPGTRTPNPLIKSPGEPCPPKFRVVHFMGKTGFSFPRLSAEIGRHPRVWSSNWSSKTGQANGISIGVWRCLGAIWSDSSSGDIWEGSAERIPACCSYRGTRDRGGNRNLRAVERIRSPVWVAP